MPLAHAILAFLDFRPLTGYDLKKYFDQSVAHFWSATQSHIYRTLEKLENDGWVKSRIIPQQGKPNRKEYIITDAGKEELQRWLSTPLPLTPVREAWLIQIFSSHGNSNETIVNLLQARRDAIASRLQAFRTKGQDAIAENARVVNNPRAAELWQITLDYGIRTYESQLIWLDETIKRVQALPLPEEQQTTHHE